MEIEELSDGLAQADVVVGESTYPRVYALGQNAVSKVINHTEHSLFLTTILVGSDFWNGLSTELQQVVSDATLVAANYERSLSIDDVKAVQVRAQQDGIEVVTMSKAEQQRFAEATAIVYEMHKDTFTDGLVENIRNA